MPMPGNWDVLTRFTQTLVEAEWLRNSEEKRVGRGWDEMRQGGSWSAPSNIWYSRQQSHLRRGRPVAGAATASHSQLTLSLAQSAPDHSQGPD